MKADIDEKLRMLVPVMGSKKVNQLRQLYFFETDPRAKRETESLIDMKLAQLVKSDPQDRIILPPPPPNICTGEISAGQVEYLDKPLYPFKLNMTDINRHMFISGTTGSGKTTFALNTIRQLHQAKVPMLIIDWETSYRDLINEFPDFEIFTVGKDIHPIHINILDVPPGITKEEYTKSLIALLANDFLSGAGSDTMFLQYIKAAYDELEKPTFEDLKMLILREIKKDMRGKGRLSGRSGLWKETVQRITQFLAIGAISNVLGSRSAHPIESLLNKNIVLEFGGIKSSRDRKFLIHVILNWISLWVQNQGIHSEQLQNVIIMEEFHNLTLKGNEDNMISVAFRELRKYGIGLIAIDQVPSEIPNAIFANTNVKVCFALSTKQDITAMSNAMNLSFDKARYLGMLRTGQAIMNVKQRSPDAFVISPPFVKQSGIIRDEELREAMKDGSGHITSNPGYIDSLMSVTSVPSKYNSSPLSSSPPDAIQKIILSSIIEKPFEGTKEKGKRLGMHPRELLEYLNYFKDEGLIIDQLIDRRKLYELTQAGRSAAYDWNISIPKKDGRGGIEHDYWMNETLQFLRKLDFQPVLEFSGIDISDIKAGFAIEIETGKSNIKANISKLVNSNFVKRFMLATTKPTTTRLIELTQNHPSITVLYIKDFLKLTKEDLK